MVPTIQLTQGQVALVDEANVEWLSQWSWCALSAHGGKFYAVRNHIRVRGAGLIYMHRVVLGAGGKEMVDHANGDTLDNRRANLRFCDRYGNAANSRRAPGQSGYRGVEPAGRFWLARIEVRGRVIRERRFTSAVEAALAYDRLARQHFGDFAVLNFPLEVA